MPVYFKCYPVVKKSVRGFLIKSIAMKNSIQFRVFNTLLRICPAVISKQSIY